ncbi:MAG: hypothetical protein KAJ55_04470 [Anaerolineales bacterium]|nr:hypothetical protein [Anaerolineales bacterium]
MTNGTDQPTPEDLASELDELETNAGNAETGSSEPETAPASEPAPEAPADPAPDRTIAPPLNTAQADKKAADTTRRTRAIADSPAPDTTASDAEEKRKAAIYEKLDAVQGDLLEAQAAVETCKGRARDLMAELYPHAQESDKLVDSVRGHIAAQKKLRASRASNPARIAEILKAAGRSPIDQAFHVQRARGMGRPTRSQAKPAADGQGDGSDANAGSE